MKLTHRTFSMQKYIRHWFCYRCNCQYPNARKTKILQWQRDCCEFTTNIQSLVKWEINTLVTILILCVYIIYILLIPIFHYLTIYIADTAAIYMFIHIILLYCFYAKCMQKILQVLRRNLIFYLHNLIFSDFVFTRVYWLIWVVSDIFGRYWRRYQIHQSQHNILKQYVVHMILLFLIIITISIELIGWNWYIIETHHKENTWYENQNNIWVH